METKPSAVSTRTSFSETATTDQATAHVTAVPRTPRASVNSRTYPPLVGNIARLGNLSLATPREVFELELDERGFPIAFF